MACGEDRIVKLLDLYLGLGWSVIPLKEKSKNPAVAWKEYQTRRPVEEWSGPWRREFPVPPHGLAVVCGKVSGVIVVDIDNMEAASLFREAVPNAPCVITSRGAHFYFAYTDGVPSTVVEVPGFGHLEIASDGKMATLPPSIHPSGHQYRWELAPWSVGRLPELPDFILEAIAEKKLASNIKATGFTGPRRRITPEALMELLLEAGVEIKNTLFISNREALRLKRCPLCYKDEGYPWVWLDTGRLVCFRATCPASWYSESKGLPLKEWLGQLGITHIPYEVYEEESTSSDVPASTLEEAREMLPRIYASSEDLIITVPPGVGKTWSMLRWLCENEEVPVVYSVPTLKLARELAEKLTKEHPPVPVSFVEGRNRETCRMWDEVKRAQELGYDTYQMVCSRCRHNPFQKSMATPCRYLSGVKKAVERGGIIITSHKQAAHLLRRWIQPKLWVIDEFDGFFETISCSDRALLTIKAASPEASGPIKTITEQGEKLYNKLRSCNRGSWATGRIYARKVSFRPWDTAKTIGELLNINMEELAAEVVPEIDRLLKSVSPYLLYKSGVSLHALRWLKEFLSGGNAYLLAHRDPERPIELCRVVNLAPEPARLKCRVIVLDATAFPPAVRKALGRPNMRHVEVHVDARVRTTHIRRNVCKESIKRGRGRRIAFEALEEALEAATGEKILVFCHKAIRREIEEKVASDRRVVAVAHHFGPEARGTNDYQDCDTVILLGLPIPSPEPLVDAAFVLGMNSQEKEDWERLNIGAYAWQEACRIRLLQGTDKHVIVVAKEWPLTRWLGEPQRVQEPPEVASKMAVSTEVAKAWVAVFHHVHKELMEVLGIGLTRHLPPLEKRIKVWELIEAAFPRRARLLAGMVEEILGRHGYPVELLPWRATTSLSYTQGSESKGIPGSIYILRDHRDIPDVPQLSLRVYQGSPGISHWSLKSVVGFSRRSWWTTILERLRQQQPELPVFTWRIRSQTTKGLGSKEEAERFREAVWKVAKGKSRS